MFCRGVYLIVLFIAVTLSHGQTKPKLSALPSSNSWQKLEISNFSQSQGYTIQSSENLATWTDRLLVLGSSNYANSTLQISDSGSEMAAARFYRARTFFLQSSNDWKNQVFAQSDPFLSPAPSLDNQDLRWIKFAIKTNEPNRVYFQNSGSYPFHYDFALARLPEFRGMSRTDFDHFSLHTNEQQIVLGALIFPADPATREVGIQFVGLDEYPREQILKWFKIVQASIEPGVLNAFYIPTFEQSAAAQANADWLLAQGAPVDNTLRWISANNIYSSGWALGRVVFLTASEISAAYADGRLLPGDILLTDAIPAEIPYVSGILTLAPATPNSHVVILARSYGVPFVYLSDSSLRAQAQSLTGKEAVLSAYNGGAGNQIILADASSFDPAFKQDLLSLKIPPPINLVPKASYGSYSTNATQLTPADAKYFGGKASNFGFLRRALPTNSPEAIAISFDLWDEFMNQPIATGKTLREEINSRLSGYSYPPDVQKLRADLAAIRLMITSATVFTQTEQSQIAAILLAKFDPKRKIRFRSSTNVEDSESFTGAGLYDSYSGCLADDLDGDSDGPSQCDPTEGSERGVFRAIRRVYASFYNENAFLERLRHNVNESAVGMAILVHYSTPDENELANGVATLNYRVIGTSMSLNGELVSQKGAVSVTNPDGSAVPEVMEASQFFGSPSFTLKQRSSLVPYGAYVLQWNSEYAGFMKFFTDVGAAFFGYYRTNYNFTLDFEYKKEAPDHLTVKQVRQIPLLNTGEKIVPFLVNQPSEWRVFEGEYGNVIANHRLKSEWSFSIKNIRPYASNLTSSLYLDATGKLLDGIALRKYKGPPSSFPQATFVSVASGDTTETRDGWVEGPEAAQTKYQLSTFVPTARLSSQGPLLSLTNLQLQLSARYEVPQKSLDYNLNMVAVTNETVLLRPLPGSDDKKQLITRNATNSAGLKIAASFWWPEPPSGATAGYTAPLVEWVGSKIEGLTSEPILLTNYYAQTYRPQHHNFSEDFLFEPRLDPGVSASLLAELEAKDIRQIFMRWRGYGGSPTFFFAGANEQWRKP